MSYWDNDISTGTYAAVSAKAAAEGKIVVPADDRTLQIDIDSEDDFRRWEKAAPLLHTLKPVDVAITESASGYPHKHITVYLPEPMDIWARIALQVLLGSHITRELLNAHRVLTGELECPIAFFELEQPKKKENGRLIEMEEV